jgi:uncharacterized protein (DUF58 family)
MKVRPRPALLGCLMAAVLLHLLTRVSGVSWLALFSGAVLGLPVVSLLAPPRYPTLAVRLQLPQRLAVGEAADGHIVVQHPGRVATPAGVWLLRHGGFGEVSGELPALRPGESLRLPMRVVAQRRGVFAESAVELSTNAPFGVLNWRVKITCEDRVIVHPARVAARRVEAEGAPTAADRSVPVAGAGSEILGLRPWRQGDALRHLSARATARHGRPVVLERERETGPSLVILAVGGGSGPTWESAVSSAAALAIGAFREGRPPLVVAEVPPLRRDAAGLLDFFAGLDSVGPPTGQDLSRALAACGSGGTLAVLAPAGAQELHGRVRVAANAAGVRVQVIV